MAAALALPHRSSAKALMQEAGLAQGLDTSFALDVGTATVGEPAAVLIQRAWPRSACASPSKDPKGANWRTTLNRRNCRSCSTASAAGSIIQYYFFWNARQQFDLQHLRLQERGDGPAIDRARFTDDPAEYDKSVKDFIALCMQEVPIIRSTSRSTSR
jgi:peptide/nickel transport system substrate-binding protein